MKHKYNKLAFANGGGVRKCNFIVFVPKGGHEIWL